MSRKKEGKNTTVIFFFFSAKQGGTLRTSGQRSKYKKRSRKLSAKQLMAIVAATLVVLSLLAVYSFHGQPNDNGSKAAIIDQLSSEQEFTNSTFVQTAISMLTAAGYQVTYYKGSDVNVDFFQTLPTDGYKILIFRVHSALRLSSESTNLVSPLDFFTSELYSTATHVEEQKLNELDIVMYNQTSTATKFFGINPSFVLDAMEGSFQNATILLEGCNGVDGQGRSETMLEALVYKGAKVIIGWNASVSESHTDIATEDLLNHLLVENETVKEAVIDTNNEIGPDPASYSSQLFNNQLLYYPRAGIGYGLNDVGGYRIPQGSSGSAALGVTKSYALPWANPSVLATPLLLCVQGPCAFWKFRKKTSSVSHNALKQ